MGWFAHATCYCQLICEANKGKHVELCQKLLETCENFVIFTDESMVQLKPALRSFPQKETTS